MYVEIAVNADLDGLPDTQAKLETQMAAWFPERFKVQPAQAALRDKIAPIYRHRRKSAPP